MSVIRKKNKSFPVQKEILERKKDEIDFLKDNAEEFLGCGNILKIHEKLMLSFNVLKYYIILLRKFRSELNANSLTKTYPNLNWNGYSKTAEFKDMVGEVDEDLNQNELKFTNLFDQCEDYIKDICEVNSKFKSSYTQDIKETDF